MSNRAEFSTATRKILCERAGYQCSLPNCGKLTVGPGPGQSQVIRIGVAAHIYSASPGGPRGTGGLSAAQLREPENGIWCCYSHGKEIDSDVGRAFSPAQLKAWKRLHEARKAAEITGMPRDRFGLVESILVNSAPASLQGRKFNLGMRNIITGPNESGKSILTRLIASVAYPDHVADLSRDRNVDIEVRWFDPYTHDLATTGRSGNVTHILDGRPVPYVARPYKTILLNGCPKSGYLGSLIALSQMFDLSSSAMKATLEMLVMASDMVKEVRVCGTRVEWVLDIDDRTVIATGDHCVSGGIESLVLLELAGIHARYHARVEPTVLLLDEMLDFYHPRRQITVLEQLNKTAEYAQVGIISHSPFVVREMSRQWAVTELEHGPQNRRYVECRAIDFEVETSTTRLPDFDLRLEY